jgi:anti-sigma regulatory factor (Ser/Thr protein kinase)
VAGERPALGIGEPVWPGRDADELVECRRHEALLNVAFGGVSDWRLLCPYDTAALDPHVLTDARRNHPHLRRGAECGPSLDYLDPTAMLAEDGGLPAPASPPAFLPFNRADLSLVRTFTGEEARRAGLDRTRQADLVLAVNELAANTMRHGGGSGQLRIWREDAELLCEVADGGRITDPLAGRERASVGLGSGRGLWLVNHLCDLVQVRSTEAGNVVRLRMRTSPA